MNIKLKIFVLVWILIFCSCNVTDDGFIYQDKYVKLWIPSHLHVELHENYMSYFGYVRDLSQKEYLYFKVDGRTPHSLLFYNDSISYPNDYAFIGQLDTNKNGVNKRIEVFYNSNWGCFVEFQYYPDSVDVDISERIIHSLKAVSKKKYKWM